MTIDKNDMDAQQARAEEILFDFAGNVPLADVFDESLGIVNVPAAPPPTTAELIESAEILKRAIVDAEQAFEVEFAPMRAKLKDAEDALRAQALAGGETIKGAHIQVQIVAPSQSVKWDDKSLVGAVAMLPNEWREAILRHRAVEKKPASTRIVYK